MAHMPKPLVRRIKSALTLMARIFYWKPLLRSKHVREACFSAAPPNTLMVSFTGAETYVLSSSDCAIGKNLFTTGSYELGNVGRALNILGRDFETLLDIGANTGLICIPAVKRGMFRRAIAFEPDPFNYRLLRCNVLLNGLEEKIETRNVALGDSPGELTFELSRTNFGDHRIRAGVADPEREAIIVKTETLDTLEGLDPAQTLIWMDTQGFEGHILAGAGKTLAGCPAMVLEFWPEGLESARSLDLLKRAVWAAGYTTMRDLKRNWGTFPVSEDAFNALASRLSTLRAINKFTDLLFT